MPIAFAPCGRELEIKKVISDERATRRLKEMGVYAGGKITLVSSSGGNVIVAVKEGRLCLDRSLAGKIIVA